MATLPTASEYVGLFLDETERLIGERFDRNEGSTWDVMAGGLSSAIRRAVRVGMASFDDNSLERAQGSALDEYCALRGPVRRLSPRQTTGLIVLSRATAAAGAGYIPEGTEIRVSSAAAGRAAVFEVMEDTLIASTSTSILVRVKAQNAGAENNFGSIIDGECSLTGSPSALFDATLRPTTGVVGQGADDEKDPELRERQRKYQEGKRGGVAAAVAYGALSVNGVKRVVLAERSDPHLGVLSVCYVGDESFNSTPLMIQEVALALESWRSFGRPLPVRGMVKSLLDISSTVRMSKQLTSYNELELRKQGVNQILRYFTERQEPYAYDLNMLRGRIGRIHDDVSSVDFASPTSSVASPISPAALALEGGYPEQLTVYTTISGKITMTFTGPT